MTPPSNPMPAHGDDDAQASVDVDHQLRAELERAETQLRLLETEYAEVLADPDVIQEDRDATRAMLEHARQTAEAARAGLARFEDGTYGRCTRCGLPIGAERLAALPDVTTCVACQEGIS